MAVAGAVLEAGGYPLRPEQSEMLIHTLGAWRARNDLMPTVAELVADLRDRTDAGHAAYGLIDQLEGLDCLLDGILSRPPSHNPPLFHAPLRARVVAPTAHGRRSEALAALVLHRFLHEATEGAPHGLHKTLVLDPVPSSLAETVGAGPSLARWPASLVAVSSSPRELGGRTLRAGGAPHFDSRILFGGFPADELFEITNWFTDTAPLVSTHVDRGRIVARHEERRTWSAEQLRLVPAGHGLVVHRGADGVPVGPLLVEFGPIPD